MAGFVDRVRNNHLGRTHFHKDLEGTSAGLKLPQKVLGGHTPISFLLPTVEDAEEIIALIKRKSDEYDRKHPHARKYNIEAYNWKHYKISEYIYQNRQHIPNPDLTQQIEKLKEDLKREFIAGEIRENRHNGRYPAKFTSIDVKTNEVHFAGVGIARTKKLAWVLNECIKESPLLQGIAAGKNKKEGRH